MLPLAITTEDEARGCVAGITAHGAWIRPSPIPATWADDPGGPFRYRRWTRVAVAAHPGAARPEDRLLAGAPAPDGAVAAADFRALLTAVCADDVTTALAAPRSAGLVRARLLDLYARRHTRGRTFLRLVFDDDVGERFDWIVPETATRQACAPHIGDGTLDRGFAAAWLGERAEGEVFLALGLTLPTSREGRFAGCQPLVVGIHHLVRPASPRPGAGP
ncbi:hypothetical protein BV133_1013 [Blastochloris viridis]|uniref:Uncharacterized protein n=1 Tax=Blastochloris viridis TaxID=1079 RepID=A0A182CZD9_BLAVI|nr:hypothetical protein BV133_1013 [Blastochloris viridis]